MMILGAGLVGVALVLVVVRSIIRPLRLTTNAIRQVNAGQTRIDLPPPGRDEFGEMALALRQFRDSAERLRRLAYHDPLTSLGNRALLDEVLKDAFEAAAAPALLYLDLDNFRSINDRFGHKAGDVYLCEAAQRMQRLLPPGARLFRYAGDKFIALLRGGGAPSDSALRALADHVLRGMAEPYHQDGKLLHMSVSIGVACAGGEPDWTQLLQQAALGCDKAKRRGINQIASHALSSDDRRDQLINIEYVEEFHRLIAAGALTLHPQPIVDISGGRTELAKAEFLMRMERNGVLMPLPKGMIESLERFGMVAELDRYSAAFILGWLQDNGEALRRLRSVSINLSAKSVADGDFMYKLYNDVRAAHLPHGKLSFEITETTAMEHLDVASDTIAEFRDIGCGFSLDDFGSGLCSFGYLQSLPVDEVKIDGRFVRQVAHDKPSREIISAIHQVAHATGKKTTAEFVDDRRKLDVLREIGVDYAQGYLFYPAVPPEKLLELLGVGVATA